MPRRQRSFIDRIKDHIGFSLIAVVVLFLILRVLGVRATISALVMSLLLTLGLNVGLSYYYEWRARREALNPPRRRSDTSRDSRGQVEWFREDKPARRDDYRDRWAYEPARRDDYRDRWAYEPARRDDYRHDDYRR